LSDLIVIAFTPACLSISFKSIKPLKTAAVSLRLLEEYESPVEKKPDVSNRRRPIRKSAPQPGSAAFVVRAAIDILGTKQYGSFLDTFLHQNSSSEIIVLGSIKVVYE
jgi:hypothetical protein